MNNENLAYDFSRFTRGQKENNVVKMPARRQEEKPKKRFSFKNFLKKYFAVVLLLAVSVVMIRGYISINELTGQISKSKKQLKEAQSEYTQLQMENASKYSLEYVEQYAKTKLGMQRAQKEQIVYVQINNKDKIEKANEEIRSRFWSKLETWWNQLF